MTATSKQGKNKVVRFANKLLESVAEASAYGWFNPEQQSRLRLAIRTEFSALADEGLLHSDEHLDMVEGLAEAERKREADPSEEPVVEGEFEEVETSDVFEGPSEDEPDFNDEEPDLSTAKGGPLVIACG